MEIGIFFGIIIFFLIVIIVQGILYWRKSDTGNTEAVNQNIIQKSTFILCFNPKGELLHTSIRPANQEYFNNLQPGSKITDVTDVNSIDKYFERCILGKKSFAIKLTEEQNNEVCKRTDLFISPVILNSQVVQVVIMVQNMLTCNTNANHITQKIELEEQRNFALKQIDAIEAQRLDLEQAFKKSSKHHIMLQKALHKIESQNTELERALDTINKQKIELERANTEIKESSRMKEIFLANTSHEIRTPLNAIIGFTNLLISTKLNEVQEKYISNIKASGNNLLVVINDILDFSKIESGKLALEQIEFDFRNLIKHTIGTLSVKSQEKDINLTYDISPDVPEIIIGDPVRLNQILINLLGNSIKFTPNHGFVRLKATLGQPNGDKIKVLFKVEDNGIGISSDKFDDIFLSFTQGESNTTRKYGGTGLGLSIVKQLIILQEGEISVESEVNKGTAFTFYVMLREGSAENVAHVKHQLPGRNLNKPQGIKILLVEDNMINQQLAFDTIKAWNPNIEIDLADNGKIALDKVMVNNYNLVLMDIQMPEMDGNEATIKIRQLPEPKCKTPIVAMTAHALKSEKSNCIDIGMNDYISKPFDPEELFAKIVQYAVPNQSGMTDFKAPTSHDDTSLTSMNDNKMEYKYINLINLRKIYQNSNDKILKIVGMCYESIPNELAEIKQVYDSEDYAALKAKSHSLKPKLGYLGLLPLQELARTIEVLSLNADSNGDISKAIQQLFEGWHEAEPEIKHLIETKQL